MFFAMLIAVFIGMTKEGTTNQSRRHYRIMKTKAMNDDTMLDLIDTHVRDVIDDPTIDGYDSKLQ